MDWQHIIFNAVGGLGLFLMGMKVMSEGMQKVAGDRLRKTLNFLTSNRIMGIMVGFFVTAVIQSSSATTVMVVGFVNAALMTLRQAVGVILGANIGTTVTGWIITLKVVKMALPILGIGVFIRFFSKSEKWKFYGEILFGFGLVFLGMQTMKIGFGPLRESQEFIAFFTRVDGSGYAHIFLGVFIGAVTTFVVQSSSATIGITIALASQGLLNFDGAVSLILGENIGTTITAILASVGGNFHAKRAALAHMMFNVLGVAVILSLFYPFIRLVENLVSGNADLVVATAAQATELGAAIGTKPYIGQHIAMAHSLFNISNVVLFAFLVPLMVKLCEKIIPTPKLEANNESVPFTNIDYQMIATPALGIAETEKKLINMAEKIAKSALMVQDIITSEAEQKELCDKVLKNEKVIDDYQKYITEFLASLASAPLTESDAYKVGNYMTLSHNLEKYGDHLEHIALIFDRIGRRELELSKDARETGIEIFMENVNFFNNSFNALSEPPANAQTFMSRSQVINRRVKKLIKAAKKEHFERLRQKACKSEVAVLYMDMLNYLDGMRSQAYNIAEVTTGTKYNI